MAAASAGRLFTAIWFMTNQKIRVSALGLQRLLGLGSYRTAWIDATQVRRPWFVRAVADFRARLRWNET